jgi:tRNA threonylcarbamoyladenosine biosynthesis protein TsaE
VPFYHIDLYRVTPDEVPDLGLREYLWTDGVSVIEWAERAVDEITDSTIKVRIDHAGYHDRKIDIEGIDL